MPAIDNHTGNSGLECPIRHAVTVTPSDATDLTYLTRALHIGTGGALRASMADGTVVTFVGLSAGWHPVRVARVHATGTTASGIVAGW